MRGECDYNLAGPLLHNGVYSTPETVLREALIAATRLLSVLNSYSYGESPEGAECLAGSAQSD